MPHTLEYFAEAMTSLLKSTQPSTQSVPCGNERPHIKTFCSFSTIYRCFQSEIACSSVPALRFQGRMALGRVFDGI
jgi:hypothetical protein